MYRCPTLVTGRFDRRLNRFLAEIRVDGKQVYAHVPSSGRMRELLVHDAPVKLIPAADPDRKTPYSLFLVRYQENWVCVDAHFPNRLFRIGIEQEIYPPFAGFEVTRAEVTWEDSRLDFELKTPDGDRCFVEVKSVTLVENGLALFPDAPTERGRRHLGALVSAARAGYRAAVVFMVQRADAGLFAPHRRKDPAFAEALAHAVAAGVDIAAFSHSVGPAQIDFVAELPVCVSPRREADPF